MNRRIFLQSILALVCLTWPVRAAEVFIPTEEFVSYMKSVLNPLSSGVREGRYYPYLTPWGPRIGYGNTVDDKALFLNGWSREEADQKLHAKISDALQQLRAFLVANYPDHPFDRLDRRAQEILLDFSITEGADKIQREFYTAVLNQNWDKLINGHLYIRSYASRPNQLVNRAFAHRWIYSETPLVPLKTDR